MLSSNAAQEAGGRARRSGVARPRRAGGKFVLRMSSMAKSNHNNQDPGRAPMNSRGRPGQGAGASRHGVMSGPAGEPPRGPWGAVPPAPHGRRLCLEV